MKWNGVAAAVVAAAVVAAAGAACLAAPGGGTSKLYVPAGIIKGSAIVSGRAFYKSVVPEDTLAGIRLGRPAREILAKWGNPSRITVGVSQSEGPTEGAPPTQPTTPPYIPPTTPTGGNPYMNLPRLGEPLGLPPPGPMGDVPYLPPYGAPSDTGTRPGQPGGGTTPILTQEEVTWTYDLPNGITLEFIITDGLITQITAGGIGPWSLSKTRTGLQLGDTYKLVLWVCGYPESQKYAGRFLRVSYVNRNRALFTFLNKKLVGITIAMVPSELLL